MAGRAQLAVTGIQDQWLTGEPQFSYFVTLFKRHTRFSTESVEMPFTGDNSFGSSVECRIPTNIGDLIRGMILKVKLGNLTPHQTGSVPSYRYYYNIPVGKSIIKYADLVIGGQIIERLTGDYIYMYDQLHSNKDDADSGGSLYFMNGHNETLTVSDSYNTFYVNLPFYFHRNPSLAIPVCALTKQLVEVRITFRDIDDDVSFKYTIPSNGQVIREKTTEGSIKSASLITDFYFITEDEKNFLLTRPMEYVITQLQKSTIQFKQGELKKSVLLKFTNPVKELTFLAKEETGPNASGGYTTIIPDNFSQLGTDIDGTTSSDNAGQSVSLSSDGSRLAVGISSGGSSSQGIVRVFDWNGTSWTQVGSDIVGLNNGDNFGHAVSLSSDGARVAIGAPFADPVPSTSNSGQVSVYELSGSTWVRMGSVFSGTVNNERLGFSVSLNSDGTKLAFGATGASSTGGNATVYSWSGSLWTIMGFPMSGAIGDEFGTSISLSSDGTRVAIGAAAVWTRGYVKVFEYDGASTWNELGNGRTDMPGEGSSDRMGFSVSLSSDGNRFAHGAIANTANSGHVRIFEYSGSSWTQVGSDIDSESPGDNFGYSVSLNSDGTRVAAGAIFNNNNRGHTRVFDWSGSSWNQIGSDIDGEAQDDYSGHSVSLSSNGLRLAIGAPNNADGGSLAGHVRVYRMDEEIPTLPEDRLLNTSSSDQSFSSVLKGFTIGSSTNTKRSDYRTIKNIDFQCNGATVFDHSGQYLAYEQALRYHTGCPDPAYEFYTYSFALNPEVYYPTGQLNMSRIIHKKLDIELDTVPTATSGSTVVDKTRNINVSVYARSYNILRIESGLAGLKF